ncbi:NineTeen Complex (NTC) component [Claviceps purpurea]|nr:NineTeen Complex (NTC) component [Claviceps purpurea]
MRPWVTIRRPRFYPSFQPPSDKGQGCRFSSISHDEKKRAKFEILCPFPRPPRVSAALRTIKMARNSEKAQSMLFRFREAQAADLGIIDVGRSRRPKVITEVESVPVCEKWRGQVLKEISRKVSRIHEPVLSDYQIRDLNDEINKLMREKHMWEIQIRNLGGPNYLRTGGRIYDEAGREIPGGGKGYKYFGRAKELPGVKELFEAAQTKNKQQDKPEAEKEIRRNVDAAYYGYGPDEEDEKLLAYEAERERLVFEDMLKNGPQEPPEGWVPLPGDTADGEIWELPTMEEVQQELVERRKQKLLDQL